ncbi:synaptopodin [Tachysurus ichikawai]
MERGHDPVRRGISWTGHGTTTHDIVISCEENTDMTGTDSWEKEKHNWVKAKPLMTSSTGHPSPKTTLRQQRSKFSCFKEKFPLHPQSRPDYSTTA